MRLSCRIPIIAHAAEATATMRLLALNLQLFLLLLLELLDLTTLGACRMIPELGRPLMLVWQCPRAVLKLVIVISFVTRSTPAQVRKLSDR